tara:strand:+ start:18500 stop:18607 length:108 start_codon:yes stop_codon:yes gene_type:complete
LPLKHQTNGGVIVKIIANHPSNAKQWKMPPIFGTN